jgi:diguanylate cyclase (GGDEF)-like protein
MKPPEPNRSHDSRPLTPPGGGLLFPLALALLAAIVHSLAPDEGDWWGRIPLFAAVYLVMALYSLYRRAIFFPRLGLKTSLGMALSGGLILWQLLAAGRADDSAFLSAMSLVLVWVYLASAASFPTTIQIAWALSLFATAIALTTATAAVPIDGILLLVAANLIGTAALKDNHRHINRLTGIIHSLYEKATTDAVTGLFNRRHFVELAEREYLRANRSERPLAMLLIDIDQFKAINDRHGHQSGDRTLRRLATHLQENIREGDLCARYGGDEFAILLIESDSSSALEVAHRILAYINAGIRDLPETEAPFSVSIGVASSEAPRSVSDYSFDQLVHQADQALYSAKRRGRNRCHYFEDQ